MSDVFNTFKVRKIKWYHYIGLFFCKPKYCCDIANPKYGLVYKSMFGRLYIIKEFVNYAE